MQTLQSHILFHQSSYFGEEELFKKAENIPEKQWRGKRRARLNMYEVESLLSIDCGAAVMF